MMSSVTVMTLSESLALNFKRIKRKNAVIAGGMLVANYPLKGEHKRKE